MTPQPPEAPETQEKPEVSTQPDTADGRGKPRRNGRPAGTGTGHALSAATPATGPMGYVIGIDTGGTYTDGVLMEYATRRVISTAKHLTTREDLSLGVTAVLDSLEVPDPEAVQLVGISSTLATNSIAEGKNRDVGLVLIGYDEDLLNEYDLDEQFTARDHAYFTGGHDSQGKEKATLDLEAIVAWAVAHRSEFEAFAVSGYFSPLNADHEQRAAEAIYQATHRPVVMGSQLSTQLDSVRRATTAVLNASLVSVMQEFIEAVRRALSTHGIEATLMVVKGDGSLMPYEEAVARPVETIVSGPAASAIGGYFLCEEDSGLMIDVGGTTTDMALVERACVDVADDGARIGEIKTAVRTARIRTAAVGCDSWVHHVRDGRGVTVGPERVTPLSRLAAACPGVREQLAKLNRVDPELRTQHDLVFWQLNREPTARRRRQLNEKQNELIDLLRGGPVSVSELMNRLKVFHPGQLEAAPLMRRGHIEIAGVTPTDVLHAQGRMDKWDVEAAAWGLDYLAAYVGVERDELSRRIFEFIAATIAEEVIVFLAARDADRLPEQIDGTWGRWFLEEFLHNKNPLLSVQLTSRFPTIGLGAPAEAFIGRVAEKLGSSLVLPRHHEVANAIGAVAGSIMVQKEALLFVQESDDRRRYTVQIAGERRSFDEEDLARAYAERRARELAVEGAEAAGACDPDVSITVEREGSLDRYVASAVGNPDLSDSVEPVEAGANQQAAEPAAPARR